VAEARARNDNEPVAGAFHEFACVVIGCGVDDEDLMRSNVLRSKRVVEIVPMRSYVAGRDYDCAMR
jgi:hypothetical protein